MKEGPELGRGYFSEEGSPFDLAIFRIVLFGYALLVSDPERSFRFTLLPPELMFAPLGMGTLLSWIPPSPFWVEGTSVLFTVCCLLALAGCFTRAAAWGAAICAVYLWGIPEFYGKVDHPRHHLVWFMAILAASPCADVLSVDAIRKAFREADRGGDGSVPMSQTYARPLRWIWLLMGIIYFFPGLWKAVAGWDWVFSESLRNHLYNRWSDLGGWVPLFRIDQYPWLLRASAAGVVLFELFFLVLVFFRISRPAGAILGFLFHEATKRFMRIGFPALQICYLSFVPWDKLSRWAGKRFFSEPLFLLYDGNCKLCRRVILSFRKFDLFARIRYVNAMDPEALAGLDWIDSKDLARDMHVVEGKRKWTGYEAYRQLALRIPFFWPLLPFLWTWPIPVWGNRIYRKVADSRLCAAVPPGDGRLSVSAPRPGRDPLVWTGLFLVTFNSVLGFRQELEAWPFSCYPTFNQVEREAAVSRITVIGLKGGREEVIDAEGILQRSALVGKIPHVMRRILAVKEKEDRERRLKGFLILLREKGFDPDGYSVIRCYATIHSSLPGEQGRLLGARELLGEFHPGEL